MRTPAEASDRGERGADAPILRRLFGRRGASGGRSVPPRQEATVVAVASGKGGTGKSFLATNLAVAVARCRRRVTLVDADYGLGNAHLLLGVAPRRTIQHVLSGESPLADALAATDFGFDLLAGGSGVHRLCDLDGGQLAVVGDILAELAGQRDLLLLDSGAGMSPQVLATLLAAHQVVLVTQPELAALTDAYALVKCLTALGATAPFHVVVNRVSRPGLGEQTFSRLAEVAERFCHRPLHFLGEVPEDPAVGLRRLGQPPLLVGDPRCATSLALEDVALKILAMEGRALPQATPPGQGVACRLTRHHFRG